MTTPNTLAARVEAAIPGADELARAEAALREARPAGRVVGDERLRDRVVTELASEMLETGTYPADAVQRLAAAREEEARAKAEREVHSEIADALKGFRQAAREDATDARLDVLRAELAEIVEGARDADQRLGSAESAEQAVKLGADAVTAWVELDTLAERWRTLHELHRKTLRDSLGDSVEPHQMHRHGLVRCLHRYGWPGFGLDPAQTAPTYPHGFNLRALEQTPAALRWAVRAHDDEEASDTYMWVPSRDDLHSADQANVEPQGAEPELV